MNKAKKSVDTYNNLMKNWEFYPDTTIENIYSGLGTIYKGYNDNLNGYTWLYDDIDFHVQIEDIFINKETIFTENAVMYPEFKILSMYLFEGYGELLKPYQSFTNNTVINFFNNINIFSFHMHGNRNFKCVTINIKENLLKNIKSQLNLSNDVIYKAFSVSSLQTSQKIKKIAVEIIGYNNHNKGARLFYEAKVKEWVSIIINEYFSNSNIPLNEFDSSSIECVAKYINDHYNSRITEDFLCQIALMSKSKLKMAFKQQYNMSITEFIQRKRINVAEHLLQTTSLSVGEISEAVGYTSHSRFSTLFNRYIGVKPSVFLNKK